MIRQSERKTVIHCILTGVYMAVAYNPGAVVVLHTPKACSHIAQNAYWLIKKRLLSENRPVPVLPFDNLYVTGLTDKEAIFGGEAILRECLLDVVRERNPDYVLVVSGCTAGVIGDDIESISKEIEQKTGVPMIAVPGAGFMNKNNIDGLLYTTKLLIERFGKLQLNKPVPKAGKVAVVFGENIFNSNEQYINELKRLLGYFGFSDILFPPSGMKIEDFSLVGQAELVLAVGLIKNNYIKTQEYAIGFAHDYKAKFLDANYPSGLAGTIDWLRRVGSLLNAEEMALKAIEQETEKWQNGLTVYQSSLQGKKYLLLIGWPLRYFDVEQVVKTLAAVGAKLNYVVLLNDLTMEEKAAHKKCLQEFTCVECYEENAMVELSMKVDFVVTTHPKEQAEYQLCLNLRRIGVNGMLNLLNKASQLVVSIGRRIIYE